MYLETSSESIKQPMMIIVVSLSNFINNLKIKTMKIQNLKNPKNVVTTKPTLKCFIDPVTGLLTPFNPRIKGNELVKSKL